MTRPGGGTRQVHHKEYVMSMRSEVREELERKRQEEILREAAKILSSKYPDEDKDEWGNPRHFSSW